MDQQTNRYIKTLLLFSIAVLAMLSVYLLFTFVIPIAGRLLKALPGYFLPFIVAVLLAFLIEPIIGFFRRRTRMSRGLATAAALLVSLGMVGSVIVAIIAQVSFELIDIYKLLAARSQDFGSSLTQALQEAQILYLKLDLPPDVQQSLQANLKTVVGQIQQIVGLVANWLMGFLAGLPEMFIFLLITAIATYFIAVERPRLNAFFSRHLPNLWTDATQQVIQDMLKAFANFLKAEALLVSMTGLQTIIGLKILGSEYALTIGLLCGLFDILPMLGPATILIPMGIWGIVSGNTFYGIGILVLYAITATVRSLMEPRIVGASVGLHPLATLIALYVGLKAGGFVGMIMGPILLIFLMACYRAGVFDRFLPERTE
ncbi:MAG: sporulation integral membrane protein YtvI [Solirubrobacterales bacterium]